MSTLAVDTITDSAGGNSIGVTQLTGAGAAGAVAFFAMSTAPTGWVKANGAAISRTAYADLYSAIGITYGSGDGSTTFNVPDMRGEFPRGLDDGRGVDSGRAIGSAQSAAFASHTHQTSNYNNIVGWSGSSPGRVLSNDFAYNDNGPQTSGSTGDTETRPRNVALLACIKY